MIQQLLALFTRRKPLPPEPVWNDPDPELIEQAALEDEILTRYENGLEN